MGRYKGGLDFPDKITLDNRQRWSEGTEVEFPYDQSSAPRGCPQDPYNAEGTEGRKSSKAVKTSPRREAEVGQSGKNYAPPQREQIGRVAQSGNAFPRLPPPPPSTTRPRRPKNHPSSGSRSGCTSGSQCVPLSNCPSFAEEKLAWANLARGSRESIQALGELKGKICKRSPQKVCCASKQLDKNPEKERPRSENRPSNNNNNNNNRPSNN